MKVLVTGGGGFLGIAVVRRLLARGDSVRSFTRGHYPEVEALGAECVQGDVADSGRMYEAARGCDLVIHTAAKAGVWGRLGDYYRSNVVGTRNVIDACRRTGISRLVYTSTPSVVFHGADEEGTDESAPYAERFLCAYASTKAEAERLVLQSNDHTLQTVALRPHLIWGPGDPHLVPRIWDRARAGRLRLVGDGNRLVDSTYVDNAAAAHLAAVAALCGGDAACAGKAYFITNGEPLPMRELLSRILDCAGLPPAKRRISPTLAYCAGGMMEAVYRLLRRKDEPLMTRFVARQLATAHWFDISAARRDLGYAPEVTLDEGFRRLKASLQP